MKFAYLFLVVDLVLSLEACFTVNSVRKALIDRQLSKEETFSCLE